ncbi:hypothetical protein SynBIOSE41_00853 [Synechococcus sp. BIOS-E4-1]|nr:hypothetical protein SynBIOSE41_00853 [Synechococcus sp. BIOS-E4-1]
MLHKYEEQWDPEQVARAREEFARKGDDLMNELEEIEEKRDVEKLERLPAFTFFSPNARRHRRQR